MKLTTKSEYSILALLYICRHEKAGYIKVEDISIEIRKQIHGNVEGRGRSEEKPYMGFFYRMNFRYYNICRDVDEFYLKKIQKGIKI